MTAFAIQRDASSLSSVAAKLLKRTKGLVSRMVIAQGRFLREERKRTLRQLNLTDDQSVLSFGSFV
jgi:hypothetical protein